METNPLHDDRITCSFIIVSVAANGAQWAVLIPLTMNKITQQNTLPPILEIKFGQMAFMETYLWRQIPCMMIRLHAALSSSNNSSHVTGIIASHKHHINSSPPGQNGHYVTDNIFRCIFMYEKFCILITISLKFILRVQLTINQHCFR